jgi:hypothetical protein
MCFSRKEEVGDGVYGGAEAGQNDPAHQPVFGESCQKIATLRNKIRGICRTFITLPGCPPSGLCRTTFYRQDLVDGPEKLPGILGPASPPDLSLPTYTSTYRATAESSFKMLQQCLLLP